MTDPVTPPTTPSDDVPPKTFRDDELVYVDPDARTVVGTLEWMRNGNPKSKLRPAEDPPKDGRRRNTARKSYPWGTYRSMKRVFKLEGKLKREENTQTLDDVLPKALKDAFWD